MTNKTFYLNSSFEAKALSKGSKSLKIAGYANKGGTGYHDFLSVTNSYGSATNANKFFRLNSTGNLEIINSAYSAVIFSLTDAGALSVPAISAGGTTGTAGQVLQSTGSGLQWASAGGNGTVTSVAAGTGLTGGTITSTGTIAIDTTVVTTLTGAQTLTNKTLTSPTINSGTLSGTFSGAVTLSDTTTSTSTTTGALKVGGGLGVAGSIYADKIYAVNNGAGTNFYVGDDVVLGDVNQANTLGLRGLQDSTQAYIVFGSSNNTAYIGRSGTNPITVTGQFQV